MDEESTEGLRSPYFALCAVYTSNYQFMDEESDNGKILIDTPSFRVKKLVSFKYFISFTITLSDYTRFLPNNYKTHSIKIILPMSTFLNMKK
jgi:purine-cytosine permease-like protein